MLLGLILVSVVLAALAQLTLKHGVTQVTSHGQHPLHLSDPLATAKRVAGSLSVWIGLLIFALSAAVWIVVLSRASLSFAYPFAALTYVLIVVFDRFVLDQNVPSLRWAGVAFIITGIVLVSRTGGHG
jgi:drug/metabolite transporter (DMT)-like permease